MKLARYISLPLALALGLGITAWFVARSNVPSASGAFQSTSAPTWEVTTLTATYGFVVTLLGVALGACYRRLLKLRADGVDKISFVRLLADVIGSVDFQIGLVGAPIVYGLLWQSLSDISLAGLTVIALQNGFTSHAILDQVVAAKPNLPKAAAGD